MPVSKVKWTLSSHKLYKCPLHWTLGLQIVKMFRGLLIVVVVVVGRSGVIITHEFTYRVGAYKCEILGDFPGSLVVKTLSSHCRGHGFDP